MSAKIRCAIIGLGRIASLLEDDPLREKPCTHAGAIVANPHCQLVAGCDIDEERRARFGERWGCSALFVQAKRMLAECAPHLVVVATHPESHRQLVEAAAQAGIPLVICEKPLANSIRNGRRIVALEQRKRLKVLVNHERRYSQDYVAARDVVQSGRFGRLISFSGTLYFGRRTRLDNMLLHDGTHMVDSIAFLIGKPLRLVKVIGSLRTRQGSAFIVARAGDISGVIEVGAERDHLVFEIGLSFERGQLTIGNGQYRLAESRSSPYYEGYRSLAAVKAPQFTLTEYFTAMLADAVACLQTPSRQPVSSASDALAALRLIHQARRRG